MRHKITLITRDDERFEFFCSEQQTVLEAAEAARLYPPFNCRLGSCGTCLAHCEKGEYRLEKYSDQALSAEAAAGGGVLLCQTLPKTDLQIITPYSAEILLQKKYKRRFAEIVVLEKIAERTLKLELQLTSDPQAGLTYEFEPGQFVELEIPASGIRRAYSLSNTPNREGRLQFLIRLQTDGRFSSYLRQTSIGQKLIVHGPSGSFVINKQSSKPRCFIAGGTGLAPFMSMLKRMTEQGHDHPTNLFLGVNNEAEILCQKELAELQKTLPQLTVEICVWKPTGEWKGFVGTPVDAFKAFVEKNGADVDLYLCGPPVLVNFSKEAALAAGVDKDHIYSERFDSP